MSRISASHENVDANGVGKCSVPMWVNGVPAGFCDKPAYGKQVSCRMIWNACNGQYQREDGKYDGYVPALACPGHGGPASRVFKDGDQWCAVSPDFVNLQESSAGFGETPDEARLNLGERE